MYLGTYPFKLFNLIYFKNLFYFSGIVQIYCPKCNNIYENNKSLFTHLMYECASDERKFQCNICLIKFSQLHLLKCHMLSQHKVLYT